MGRFINGMHVSWTSDLAPNERLGVEDDMEFNRLATQLEEEENLEKEFQNILDDLVSKLEHYNNSRDKVIETIEKIIKKFPDKNIYSEKLNTLAEKSAAVEKILDYYIRKFSQE